MPRNKPTYTVKHFVRLTEQQTLHVAKEAKRFGITTTEFLRFLVTTDMKLKIDKKGAAQNPA